MDLPFEKYITKITIKQEEVELPEHISLVTTEWGDLHVYGDNDERLFVMPSSGLQGMFASELTEEQTEAVRQRIIEVIRSARWA